jgi:hypothetical protein
MQMDSRIILAGQQPDFANALAGGVQAGQAVRQAQTQNALADLFKTQGAGIMSGDQNALNALAQISPEAALGIQNSRQVMDARRQDMGFASRRMEILNAQEARQIEEYAATKTAAERAAEAAQIEDAVKMGMMIQSPEQWDQVMATQAPDLVGQFGNRDVLAGKYMTMAEILKQTQGDPEAVTQGAPQGYMWANPQDRTQGVVPIQGYQAAPADEYGRYAAEETKAGRTPLDRIGYEQAKKGNGFNVTTPDGTVVSYGGSSPKPFTEAQSKDTTYSVRARGALKGLDPVATALTDRVGQVSEMVPLGFGKALQSDDFQLAKQYGNEFLQAILRKDTGAAITAPEQQLYGETYLPQPGDSPARLEAKAKARERAVLAIESGMSPEQILAQGKALLAGGDDGSSIPRAGMVEDGWRFKGGDASNPANWEQVR